MKQVCIFMCRMTNDSLVPNPPFNIGGGSGNETRPMTFQLEKFVCVCYQLLHKLCVLSKMLFL